MSELRFDHQVVVVTGAGAGLGKSYATFFASRGASVVVNDLGGSGKGEGSNSKVADQVVAEIIATGGKAVANYDSAENGDRIIQTAISCFGRIDILINNAGILRDVSFRNMTDKDWDLIMAVHLRGTYKCARAAWPYFEKQKYGRIINTSSGSGLFGNFGQSNYAAAKLAIVGFTNTLAVEGRKHNILANVLAPGAGSRLTATVMSPERLEAMHPDWVVPIVAVLVHRSNTDETGSIFEAAAGHFSKIRWERSEGTNDNYAPGILLKKWSKTVDFSRNVQYPKGGADPMAKLESSAPLSRISDDRSLDFSGKVALITGGGTDLGRAYCHAFAKLGATVVVNDMSNANAVAEEIKNNGGKATALDFSAENGDKVVQTCIGAHGRIDILVNVGPEILEDKPFSTITDVLWEKVLAVHLRGTYKVTRAAWPFMLKQKYGRVVNVTSTAGIYGKFGQSNYTTANAGVIGFGQVLAREGAKYNIHVNMVVPTAGNKPESIAPLVLALCSDRLSTPTGGLYESGSGWIAKIRWQRTRGVDFPLHKKLAPEEVLKAFPKILDFEDGRADNPTTPADGGKYTSGQVQKFLEGKKSSRL